MSREDKPHFGSVADQAAAGPARPPRLRDAARGDGAERPRVARPVRRLPRLGLRPLPGQQLPGLAGLLAGRPGLGPGLTAARVDDRRRLLEQLGRNARDLEAVAATTTLDPHYVKAFDVISSPPAQKAFDIEAEPESSPRAVRQALLRPVLPAGPPPGRGGRPARADQLAPEQHRRPRRAGVRHPRQPLRADPRPALPADRPGVLDPDRGPRRARAARRDDRHLLQRVRPDPQGQPPGRPRPLAAVLQHAPGRRRDRGGRGLRGLRQDRRLPGGRPGHAQGRPGDALPPPGRRHRDRSSTTT